MKWESYGIALLTAALLRPFGLAAAAWLTLWVLKVRHPASRHAVWTAVLVGMLLLPVVSVLTPHWELLVFPAKYDLSGQAPPLRTTTLTTPGSLDSAPRQAISTSDASSGKPVVALAWPAVEKTILRCYLAGLFAMIIYRLVGWGLLCRVVSRSRPIRAQRVRESDDVLTPVAVGVLRPAVLLPAGWRGWNTNTRRAVLAHEFAHLRRHDPLISALGRFVNCVFWFHPLAWWVSRKISELAELACDAAALERVDDPAGYSRILIEFAETVNRAGRRVALPGLAMAASSGMGQRIDQVFELSSGAMRKLARPRAWLSLMGLPVMCLAATMGLGTRPPRPTAPPSAAPDATSAKRFGQNIHESSLETLPADPLVAPQLLAQLTPEPAPKFETPVVNNVSETVPPEVDAALRDRITMFYQAHVDKKFRQADQYVAEDTKDFFFAANKPAYLSFRIDQIAYSENFTKAKVIVLCKQHIMVPGFTDTPVEVPTPDTWKLENGQWYWYFDLSHGRDTPFGHTNLTNSASSDGGLPAAIPSLDSISKAVRADKNAVLLNAKGASLDEVKIATILPGSVTLRLEVPTVPGLKVILDRTELKPGEQARVSFQSEPVENTVRKPFEVRILVEPLNLVIPVQVAFQ